MPNDYMKSGTVKVMVKQCFRDPLGYVMLLRHTHPEHICALLLAFQWTIESLKSAVHCLNMVRMHQKHLLMHEQ